MMEAMLSVVRSMSPGAAPEQSSALDVSKTSMVPQRVCDERLSVRRVFHRFDTAPRRAARGQDLALPTLLSASAARRTDAAVGRCAWAG
jgi:hypothetical protein